MSSRTLVRGRPQDDDPLHDVAVVELLDRAFDRGEEVIGGADVVDGDLGRALGGRRRGRRQLWWWTSCGRGLFSGWTRGRWTGPALTHRRARQGHAWRSRSVESNAGYGTTCRSERRARARTRAAGGTRTTASPSGRLAPGGTSRPPDYYEDAMATSSVTRTSCGGPEGTAARAHAGLLGGRPRPPGPGDRLRRSAGSRWLAGQGASAGVDGPTLSGGQLTQAARLNAHTGCRRAPGAGGRAGPALR